MVNWLFICTAIIRYAEKHAKTILMESSTITLDDILNYYGEHFKTKEAKFLSEYLKAYVNERKAYFRKDYERGDYASDRELAEDKKYVFTYKDVSWLF
jgi:hypothetical protein